MQAAEDAWNTRDPERVALAYTEDFEWRNRVEFITGRTAIKDLLTRKWTKELDYRLKSENTTLIHIPLQNCISQCLRRLTLQLLSSIIIANQRRQVLMPTMSLSRAHIPTIKI